MDIQLINSANYALNQDKCNSVDFEVVKMLTGLDYKPTVSNAPKYVAFKSREDFVENSNNYDINTTKEVLINEKGFLFCQLNDNNSPIETKKLINESADTKENKGK